METKEAEGGDRKTPGIIDQMHEKIGEYNRKKHLAQPNSEGEAFYDGCASGLAIAIEILRDGIGGE